MVTLRNWLVNLDMRKNTQAVWITYGKIARTGQISNAQVYSINENRCEFELCSRSLWLCVCHQQHSLWRTSRLGASECSRSPCYRFRSKTVPSSSIAKSTKIYKFGIESNDQMIKFGQCYHWTNVQTTITLFLIQNSERFVSIFNDRMPNFGWTISVSCMQRQPAKCCK